MRTALNYFRLCLCNEDAEYCVCNNVLHIPLKSLMLFLTKLSPIKLLNFIYFAEKSTNYY